MALLCKAAMGELCDAGSLETLSQESLLLLICLSPSTLKRKLSISSFCISSECEFSLLPSGTQQHLTQEGMGCFLFAILLWAATRGDKQFASPEVFFQNLGWRDGLASRSTQRSPRGPLFESQYLHGVSVSDVTPVHRDPTIYSCLQGHAEHTQSTKIHAGKTSTHIK